ncbi:hypothetical protein OTSTA763_1920 [Orientia tsutsugamushi str. TA763]|nr:hypothetical protein OTSTA763_1920 [Orientia tsutsugamushi str. TA763]
MQQRHMAGNQIEEGRKYSDLKEVIFIAIADYKIVPKKKTIYQGM